MTGFLLHITFALFSIKTQDFPIINFVLRPRRKKKMQQILWSAVRPTTVNMVLKYLFSSF